LAIAMLAFLSPGDTLAYPHPTYSLYPVLAELDEVKSPRCRGSATGRCRSMRWSQPRPRDFLANPNAPSATFVSPQKIEELCKKFNGVVLVDEAYVDFADDNCLPLLKDHDNIVITRTLSKAYSLAGLRFGYAVARAEVIKEMNKARDSYPCDAVSVAAATAAIQDQEYAKKTWGARQIRAPAPQQRLTQMGWKVLPSESQLHPRRRPRRPRQTGLSWPEAAGHLSPILR
jgi:histidinol-phosphate aminotransferase